MKIITKLDKPVDTIEDIFCNKCGMSCRSPGSPGTLGDFYGLIEAEVTGGYHSTHFEDGEVQKFSLCERCVKEIINTFHYPSFQGNFFDPNPATDASDFDPKKYLGEPVPDDILAQILQEHQDNPLIFDPDTGEIIVDDDTDEYVSLMENSKVPKKEDMN